MANTVHLTDGVTRNITNTTTETELSTVSTTLGAQDALRIISIGSLLVNTSATDFENHLYLSGSAMFKQAQQTIGTNASRWAVINEWLVFNRNSQSSQFVHGKTLFGPAGSYNAQTSGNNSPVHGATLATVDFSTSKAISIRGKFSVAGLNNIYDQYACLVEKVVATGGVGGNDYLTTDTTTTDITTTGEQTLFTYTISAGTMGANDWLRVYLPCNYLNNSGANRQVELKAYLGGTLIGSCLITAIATNTNRYAESVVLYIAAQNSQSAQATGMKILHGPSVNSWGTGLAGVGRHFYSVFTTTKDMTLAQDLELKVTHDALGGTLSLQRRGGLVERIPGV